MRFTTFESPVGMLTLAGDEAGLRHLYFAVDGSGDASPGDAVTAGWQRDDEGLSQARDEVLAYLAGRRRSFNMDIAPEGSQAQREVWAALMRIPYGTTRTYGELAQRLGEERAVITVSSAIAANPLPILVPCHRVVAANRLGSYPGGEALKRKLLAMEADESTGVISAS
ncbi:methylated-DNA--[protein]-cysteine S-methyltransferase [Halomonas sp. IOP_31]|uniref:methylated-DNA--[protein]-cysteine S-methyltransferase n=1 Tax=Halomonas sp. IOP_31 TaxID=2876584 RepID=UPI001E531AFC|nr:methylated-DNA--[protein]-cysteine S-methyltransferase [Halomonas sp. IOP_31]MCD6007911.1 methylated-DNA--[protein]-cysteine S-methyltransferase [Halomonas sp. IOP_31]